MATPRKVYSPERRAFLLNNALRIVRAYKRKLETVVLPVYFGRTPELGPLQKFNEGKLILFKLHFKQLKYTLQCLGWPVLLEYAGFVDVLNKLIKDHEKGIVFIELNSNGTTKLELSTDVPEFTLSGLTDHLKLLTLDPDEVSDLKDGLAGECEIYSTELGCIEVCIDSEASVPCLSTTHPLKDKWVFEEAEERVKNVETEYKRVFATGSCDLNNSSHDRPEILQSALEIDEQESEEARIQTFLEEDDNSAYLESAITATKLPLIYNPMQQVMNAGEFTVALYRDGKWCTPHASTGCRLDPLRTALLKFQVLEELVISVQDLDDFEDCLLLSAHHGILRGVITGSKPELLSKVGRKRKVKPVVKEAPYISEKEAKKRSVQAQNMRGKKIPGTSVFRI